MKNEASSANTKQFLMNPEAQRFRATTPGDVCKVWWQSNQYIGLIPGEIECRLETQSFQIFNEAEPGLFAEPGFLLTLNPSKVLYGRIFKNSKEFLRIPKNSYIGLYCNFRRQFLSQQSTAM